VSRTAVYRIAAVANTHRRRGVTAYMVALAWYGIELFGSVSGAPDEADRGQVTGQPSPPDHGRTEPLSSR
jgi:hypothetical protein